MSGLVAFLFQPLSCSWEPDLTVCCTSLFELNNRSANLLVQKLMHIPIQVTACQPLGILVNSSFHDIELSVPVIGELPPSLARDHNLDNVLFTFLTRMITTACHETLQNETICSTALGNRGDIVVYAFVTQPGGTTSGVDIICLLLKKPHPSFGSEIDPQLVKADALMTKDQRDALQKSFHNCHPIFLRAAPGCRVPDLHIILSKPKQSAAYKWVHAN